MKKFNVLCMVLLLVGFSAQAYATQHYGENFCHDPRFSCIKVKRGQSWESLWPDAYQREIVKRLNRDDTPLYSGQIVAVPNKLDQLTLNDVSPFPSNIDPQGHKLIVVEPSMLAWGAYDQDGRLIFWGPMSGGQAYCSDMGANCRTKTGIFFIYNKDGPKCRSKLFPVGRGGAPMPYCMYFKGGYALHASTEVPGYHASHGCVRIFFNDAKWLNQNFVETPSEQNNYQGTEVIINPYGA